MKKYILTAVAASAVAFGGAASAQDLGAVLGNVVGSLFGTNQGYAQPYGSNSVYVDAYGRRVIVDQYGRHIAQQPHQGAYGSVDAWGRPTNNGYYAYGGQGYAYPSNNNYGAWDSDGDGVANTHDRWPNDRRYR